MRLVNLPITLAFPWSSCLVPLTVVHGGLVGSNHRSPLGFSPSAHPTDGCPESERLVAHRCSTYSQHHLWPQILSLHRWGSWLQKCLGPKLPVNPSLLLENLFNNWQKLLKLSRWIKKVSQQSQIKTLFVLKKLIAQRHKWSVFVFSGYSLNQWQKKTAKMFQGIWIFSLENKYF